MRDARAEHAAAVAEVMAEFNAEIAELRRELLAQLDATVSQVKANTKKWPRCKDNWPRPARS